MKKPPEASTRGFSLWELKVILENECKYDKLSLISFELLYNSSHLFFRPIFFPKSYANIFWFFVWMPMLFYKSVVFFGFIYTFFQAA